MDELGYVMKSIHIRNRSCRKDEQQRLLNNLTNDFVRHTYIYKYVRYEVVTNKV